MGKVNESITAVLTAVLLLAGWCPTIQAGFAVVPPTAPFSRGGIARNGGAAGKVFPRRISVLPSTPSFLSKRSIEHEKDTLHTDHDDDEEEEEHLEMADGVTLDEMDWETAEMERRQAQRVWIKLMLPYEVGRYVTTALWIFVGVGFLLNVCGYAYVWTADGHLTIDTLAQREFQNELARGLRQSGTTIQ